MTAFGPYPATVARVIDGDTLTVDVRLAKGRKRKADRDLGFDVRQRADGGVWLVGQHVRLKGCNAPEHGTPDGDAATAWLDSFVPPGAPVTLVSHGWDKYGGRIDGTLATAAGEDVTAALIAAGHAKPWDGTGPKP